MSKKRTNGEGTIYFDQKKKLWIWQKTINGKRCKVSSKSQKDLKEKMKNLESNNVMKSSLTLLNIIEKLEKERLESNIISEGTYYRDCQTLKHIKDSYISELNISKISSNDLQTFLNSKLKLSQSLINKICFMLNNAFKKAMLNDLITKNPMVNVVRPTSIKPTKEVIAFEVFEEKELIDYILSHDLIANTSSKYDSTTIKNLILLGFFTGMREGELGAIDYEKNIDFEKEQFEINRTLTKDTKGKTIIGTSTKTGRVKTKQGKRDIKIIPFTTYDKDFIVSILQEQIEISKSNKFNINKLLFCRIDGTPIVSNEVNNIFKRICREAGVKKHLTAGCHFHMLRHTFATRCIEARLELLTIAKLLGHNSTEQIEKTYGHILDKFRNEELTTLNNYYDKEKIIVMEKYKTKKRA